MKNMIICPECGGLVFFNSYFGAYICPNCSWEDDSYGKKRDACTVTLNIDCSSDVYRIVKAEVTDEAILVK